MASLGGHKQRKEINMFIHNCLFFFFWLGPLGLAIVLNFNISKVTYHNIPYLILRKTNNFHHQTSFLVIIVLYSCRKRGNAKNFALKKGLMVNFLV